MTGRALTIALAQRIPRPVDEGLDGFVDDVSATLAAYPDVDLLVFPEMHLHDADHLPEQERPAALRAAAVSLDSDYVKHLGLIAAQHHIWLCPGSIGVIGDDGSYTNTQLVFDPAGQLRAAYDKMFPWRPFEPHKPGTKFVVQGLDGAGAIGLSNCFDAWFPEHTRQLTWLGAELVLNVVRTTTPDREQELVLARANAIVNQVYMASVNAVGSAGRGRSIAVDPEGFVLAEAGIGEQTLVFTYDPARVASVRANGTMQTNRMWSQFMEGDEAIPLPLYGGRIDPATWAPRSITPESNAR